MRLSGIAGLAFVLAAALLSMPSAAQQTTTVADVTVRFGIVNALEAEHVDAQHGVHKGGHGSGMEHLVVTLADASSGSHIGGAKVFVEVRDPKGGCKEAPAGDDDCGLSRLQRGIQLRLVGPLPHPRVVPAEGRGAAARGALRPPARHLTWIKRAAARRLD
jgi:hypothetical protein